MHQRKLNSVEQEAVLQRPAKMASIVIWAAQIVLGLAIAGGGMLKLSGDPTMVAMFCDVGTCQWFRLVVGALEVAGGAGLLVPHVRALAALRLLTLLLCASIINVTVLGTTPLSALVPAAVAPLILVARRRELPAALRVPRLASRPAVGR